MFENNYAGYDSDDDLGAVTAVEDDHIYMEDMMEEEPDSRPLLERLSGVTLSGEPGCVAIIQIGNEESTALHFETSPLEFHMKRFGETYIIDLLFSPDKKDEMYRVYGILDDYMKHIDETTGEYDVSRMCSFLFMENSPYREGFMIAMSPLFFAITGKDHTSGIFDTIRFAVFREYLTIYDEAEGNDDPFIPDGV